MEVAQEGALGPGVGSGLGIQPRQLCASKHPRLRHEEDAAHAALQNCAAGLVLSPIWHLLRTSSSQMHMLLSMLPPG